MIGQEEQKYMSRKSGELKPPNECNSIEEIREAIDEIDHEIVAAIGHRFEYVKAIMRFKSTAEDVRAPQRYQAVLQQRRKWATEEGLDPDVVEKLYRDLIDYFIAHEMTTLEASASGYATDVDSTRQVEADPG